MHMSREFCFHDLFLAKGIGHYSSPLAYGYLRVDDGLCHHRSPGANQEGVCGRRSQCLFYELLLASPGMERGQGRPNGGWGGVAEQGLRDKPVRQQTWERLLRVPCATTTAVLLFRAGRPLSSIGYPTVASVLSLNSRWQTLTA